MITSLKNPKIKLVRSLQISRRARQRERLYVMEGPRLLAEVVRADSPLLLVLHADHLCERERGLVNNLARLGAAVEVVSDEIMAACSATEHNQGLLAVLPAPRLTPPTPLTFALVCDQINDPGNLGTMLRTADAAGVETVLLAPGTVDAYNPKVVRAAAGAHLRLPIESAGWDVIARRVTNCTCWLAAARAGAAYGEVDWSQPVALVVGSEAHGGSPQAQQLADKQVHVPMPGAAESLNVAVATGVLLMEAARQRFGGTLVNR